MANGRLNADARYLTYGVAPDHCLIWPRHPAPYGRLV